jgi:protein ImuB
MFGCLHSPSPLSSEEALFDLAREFTPRVEARSPTPVLLDLSGLRRLWPDPAALGRAIQDRARARGHDPNVALAGTRTAAFVLARGRAGLTVVPPGGEAAALAPLPLDLLDLDPDRLALLQRWGLRSLGDLAALPAVALSERLGPDGPRLRRQARGEDDAPLVARASAERFELTLDLDWPVDGLEPLSFLLARVLEPLCASLVSRGRRALGLGLDLRLVDGSTHERALRPAAPSADPRTWRTLLLLDLEAHPPRDAIQSLTVHAEPTPSRTVQFSLLDPAQPSPEKLAETMARLHEWTKDGRSGAPAVLDTHRPGAFAVGTFAPGPVTLDRRTSRTEAGTPTGSSTEAREPSPPQPRVALRAFRPPWPAEVALQGGAPVFVSAPGVRGAVLDRAGPWRASGDWWDGAYSREEWDVSLGAAGLYRIFRDRLREAWFVEGELD